MSATATLPTVHENDHGLLLHAPGELFGHLMHFQGHGVYDPTHGKVDVDPALVDAHNRTLDEALLKGLDENCEIGQGNYFYLTKEEDRDTVTTFTGKLVTTNVTVKGANITFKRAGKTFRGRLSSESQAFNFKRTA